MKTTIETDLELVARCKIELPYETQAFEHLIHRYRDKVMGKVVSMLQNRDEAEDVCQDIFVEAFQGCRPFRVTLRFRHGCTPLRQIQA